PPSLVSPVVAESRPGSCAARTCTALPLRSMEVCSALARPAGLYQMALPSLTTARTAPPLIAALLPTSTPSPLPAWPVDATRHEATTMREARVARTATSSHVRGDPATSCDPVGSEARELSVARTPVPAHRRPKHRAALPLVDSGPIAPRCDRARSRPYV